MDQEKLLQDFEKEFDKLKEERGFKSTLDDIDNIFFIKDLILKEKYISKTISRTICYRIVDTYTSWAGYLHSLLMPNPSSIIAIEEHKLFNDKEKVEMMELMRTMLTLTSKNMLVGLTKNKKMESEFIDKAVNFWHETSKPKLIEIATKVNEHWSEKSETKEERNMFAG